MAAMRTVGAIRRLRAERRLFEVHADLAVAREDAAALAGRHAQARQAAEAARVRMLASETALAHGDFEEARRTLGAAARRLTAARVLVAQLEAARDALFDELLAPEP